MDFFLFFVFLLLSKRTKLVARPIFPKKKKGRGRDIFIDSECLLMKF